MKKLLALARFLPLLLLLLLLRCPSASATIASVGTLGGAGNEVSGTTLAWSPTATLEAGNVALLIIVCDNTGTTDSDFSEVSGVVDTVGNTYTKLKEFTNGQGAAAAGVTVSLWMTRATTNLTTGGTITVTFANTITAKVTSMWEFTVSNDLTVAGSTQNATDASNGWGSLSISGLPSAEYLFFRALGKESNSATALTPTTNYTALGTGRSGNVGGGVDVLFRAEFRIITATGETSNPTLVAIADNASVFIALAETGGAPTPLRRRPPTRW